MKHKNIDRLFQEQLKNLEVSPNKKVWNNIEAKLQKKKRSFLPFWWFSGGVAALLILGFLLFPFSKKTNQIENNIITNSSKDKINIKKEVDSVIIHQQELNQILITEQEQTEKTKEVKHPDTFFKVDKNKVVAKNKKLQNKEVLVGTKSAIKNNFIADNSSEKVVKNSDEKLLNNKEIVKKETEFLEENTSSKKTDLTDFVNKKEDSDKEKSIQRQWMISPVFAVLNSGSFSNTSPIDKNLSNTTKGKNTYSYGVQVAYKINKKWTIQSGVHLQEMSYTNNQVFVITDSNSSLSTFSFGNENISFLNTNQKDDSYQLSNFPITGNNGDLVQTYGYIEIPVEVKYNFYTNKKFDTQLVIGFSSLFLNKNKINLFTNEFSKSAKASNLNTVNFSGNLGFDLNYHLDKKWSLNLTPMFKTQLNTFNSNSNNFSPFNFGVYSGIKYHF